MSETRAVLGYELLRKRTGDTVNMYHGLSREAVPEPRETYAVFKDGVLIASGSVNATTFCCPAPYGTGSGLAATDEQIVFAVTHDEPVFGYREAK